LIQMIFAKQVDNTLLVTRQFLKLLKVNVTETTLEYTLTSHPDYPAFASISDALVKWKISNMIARIDPDKLSKMDVPFITRLKTGEGMYVVVKNITEESVTFLSTTKTERAGTTGTIVLLSAIDNKQNKKCMAKPGYLANLAMQVCLQKNYLIRWRDMNLRSKKTLFHSSLFFQRV
jgi:hypothetical protein